MSRTRTVTLAALAACSMLLASGGAPSSAADRDDRESRRAMRFMELYDTNNDGKVTVDEITADQGRLFGAVDVNGDKVLSVDEFRRRGRLFRSFATTTLFDLLDTNGDQKLTAAEISAPTERWFSRYDENKDGMMEASELPSRHSSRGGHGRGPRH